MDIVDTQATPIIEDAPSGQDVLKRTVAIEVRLGGFGTTRKVDPDDTVQDDLDPELLRVSKKLLLSDELTAVRQLTGQIRRYLREKQLPSLFRGGVHLLPVGCVEEVDARLTAFRADRLALIDAFIAAYIDRIDEARTRLGRLFDADDYPPAEDVRATFEFTWRYVSFDVPSNLKAVSRAVYERARAQAEAEWSDAAGDIQQALRESMGELCTMLMEKLAPAPDGVRKLGFSTTNLAKLENFLDTFAARNVTDDDALARLVAQAREIVQGQDAKAIRADASRIREQFRGITAQVESLIGVRGVRRIAVADEE